MGSIAEEVMRHQRQGTVCSPTRHHPLPAAGCLKNTRIRIVEDGCGCGGAAAKERYPPTSNPVLHLALITPPVTESPVIPHEGRARSSRSDQTVLHDSVYYTSCSRQRIDNQQLKMIDDTVRYALTDPNVEIVYLRQGPGLA